MITNKKRQDPWDTANLAIMGLLPEQQKDGMYYKVMAEHERIYLQWALQECGYKLNETARFIGMNKSTFIRKLHIHGIHPKLSQRRPIFVYPTHS